MQGNGQQITQQTVQEALMGEFNAQKELVDLIIPTMTHLKAIEENQQQGFPDPEDRAIMLSGLGRHIRINAAAMGHLAARHPGVNGNNTSPY